jgi:hypothetical protein
MRKFQSNQINKIRAFLLVGALCLFSCGIFYARFAPNNFVASADTSATPPVKVKKQKARTEPARKEPASPDKYSEFPHNKHKLACSSCHKFPSSNWETVRKTDAFPDVTDYPHHESCLNCHRQQFFSGGKSGSSPAICSICHTNPSPDDSSRHPFPNPREIFDQSPKGKRAVSDFQIDFPHDKHIEIVGENRPEQMLKGTMFVNARMRRGGDATETSCAVCHQIYKPQGNSDDEFVTKPPEKPSDAFWLKKGTFKTTPTGHTTCFTCHSQDTGILPAPDDCAVCHKLAPETNAKTDFDAALASTMGITDKIMLTAWQKRDSSATFRHEFVSHTELKCASCHNAATIKTLDAQTKKVGVTSCSGCHITATSDDGGILNYEIDARKKDAKFECVKCHNAFGKAPIPDSHFKAVAEVK